MTLYLYLLTKEGELHLMLTSLTLHTQPHGHIVFTLALMSPQYKMVLPFSVFVSVSKSKSLWYC